MFICTTPVVASTVMYIVGGPPGEALHSSFMGAAVALAARPSDRVKLTAVAQANLLMASLKKPLGPYHSIADGAPRSENWGQSKLV